MTTTPTHHTADDVRRMIRVAIATEGIKQREWAERHGMTQGFVSAVIVGRRQPSPRLLEVLGLERVTVYRRKAA